MLDTRWFLQGQAELGCFVISDIAGEYRRICFSYVGLRALDTLASLAKASFIGHWLFPRPPSPKFTVPMVPEKTGAFASPILV